MRSGVILSALFPVFLSAFAYAEETRDERIERLREEARQHRAEEERKFERATAEALKNDRTFVFLSREGKGAFRALSVEPFGLKAGECRMDWATGAVQPNSHFQMRSTDGGQTVEILARNPKTNWLLAIGPKEEKPLVRWKLKRLPDGSFDVCDANSGKGLNGCKNWTIATLENVDSATFIKGIGDKHAIASNDITQGNLGTCTLWAAVLAVLESRRPEEIEKLFSSDDTVTFPDQKPIGVGDQFLFYWHPRSPDHKSPIGADFGDMDAKGRKESWPLLLEKAYTIWRRSLENADSGANPAAVLELITGEKVKTYDLSQFNNKNKTFHLTRFTKKDGDKDRIYECLREAHTKGLPIVCGTVAKIESEEFDEGVLSPSHAYAISSVTGGENPTVFLLNPHGAPTIPMTKEQFFANFSIAAHPIGPKTPAQKKRAAAAKLIGDTVDGLQR